MKIVEAYVLNIARREARKAFGSEPSIETHRLFQEHTNYEVSWNQAVISYGHDAISIATIVHFQFPKVYIRISKCCHDQGPGYRGGFYDPDSDVQKEGHTPVNEPWHKKSFDIMDPASKKQLVQFFTETYKAVKKETLNRQRMRELIFRRQQR